MLSEINQTRKKKTVWSYLYWICEILEKKSQANRDKIAKGREWVVGKLDEGAKRYKRPVIK